MPSLWATSAVYVVAQYHIDFSRNDMLTLGSEKGSIAR